MTTASTMIETSYDEGSFRVTPGVRSVHKKKNIQ